MPRPIDHLRHFALVPIVVTGMRDRCHDEPGLRQGEGGVVVARKCPAVAVRNEQAVNMNSAKWRHRRRGGR
jgi:hypothetical protein